MTLFERFFGERPEALSSEQKQKIVAMAAEGADPKEIRENIGTTATPKPEVGANAPNSATHAEIIEAWQAQPGANDPATRAADKVALERAKAVEQAQAAPQEEGQTEIPEKSN